MCVSFLNESKRKTTSFMYIDGNAGNNGVKVRVVEAKNGDNLIKVGVKDIKYYFIVHSYLGPDHIFYKD